MRKLDFPAKHKIQGWVIAGGAIALIYLLLQNADYFLKSGEALLGIISPFIVGFGLAFVLNNPLRFIETRLLAGMGHKKWGKKLRRPVAMLLTYLLFLLLLSLAVALVIPQIASSISSLVRAVPSYLESLQGTVNSLVAQYGVSGAILEYVAGSWQEILTQMGKLITGALPMLMDMTVSLGSGVSKLFIGFIVSIYLLAGKERFAHQAKQLLRAYLPPLYRDRMLRLGNIAYTTFNGFISGQLLDALIVGLLCFLGMNLLPLAGVVAPYMVLISTIIAFTNIIPIFGPYIGGVPCTFIILMLDFKSAVWFVVLIVLIQTVDGNIILPKIVGDSIGLSGFWVMFSIIVGGGLFGLAGMILGIPTFATFYKVMEIITHKRLAQKIKAEEQHNDGEHTITTGEQTETT